MGVSIHGYAYLLEDLNKQVDEWLGKHGGVREGAEPFSVFFENIAGEFGIILGEHFVTVYNEYYEGYNPDYEFQKAIERYYFPGKDWDEVHYRDTLDFAGKYFGGGASAGDVLESLYEDEFGYEGEFSDEY